MEKLKTKEPEQVILPKKDASKDINKPHISSTTRVCVHGKFLFVGDEKFWVKGVTYGTFRPTDDGTQYPTQEQVSKDFALMAENGINTVRTYTPPPRWLLDIAQKNSLRVMVGLAWEQHVTFLDDKKLINTIEGRIRDAVKSCSGHPALLCFSIGNEIPPSIVRWHGRRQIERFLRNLYDIAKSEDPDGLVTYVNFPTTEYLQLPFLDFQCFNVYLESRDDLADYLARLQNLVGDQPLVMAEIGLDSQRNGEQVQAESLDWQIRTAFAEGCAGSFVFTWTDEWYRGGYDIEDWDFGLTTRSRIPKPALQAVSMAYNDVPFPKDTQWPKISVVVCSYNGSATIRDTMEGLQSLDYPDYEVIVVNDGSKDATPKIVSEYNVKLINTENRGLSNARNTGWQEASGEIIAYIDDDAYPDSHWLQYLAHTFLSSDYVGVGGPNIAPPGDGPIADCVANAPGRPVHVLLSDREAEHIPGCNMSFKREALSSINGFDPRYRAAGDDVDLCWRLQEQGWKIGFHAAAIVWHHCRNSIKTYWKQQQGYGKAEALLEEKWPENYNVLGHFTWSGRLYGKGLTEPLPSGRSRIYQGQWGSALFQSLYNPSANLFSSLPLMPEWYFLICLLGFFSVLSLSWPPMAWFFPFLLFAIAAPVTQSILSSLKADFPTKRANNFILYVLTTLLHLAQPLARLIGRLKHGLTLWRIRTQNASSENNSWNNTFSVWSEHWRSSNDWLDIIYRKLRHLKVPVETGSNFDSWDIQVNTGLFGIARLSMAIEEHGAEKQLLRFRVNRRLSNSVHAIFLIFIILSILSAIDSSWVTSFILGSIPLLLFVKSLHESNIAAYLLINEINLLEINTK